MMDATTTSETRTEPEAVAVYEPAVLPDGTLLKDAYEADPFQTFYIDADQIHVDHARNQRGEARTAKDAKVRRMAASIEKQGVLQDLSVNLDANGAAWLEFGFGRYVAITELVNANRKPADQILIPIKVREGGDNGAESKIRNVHENLHRLELNPIDLGLAIQTAKAAGKKHAEIAADFGIAESSVSMHFAMMTKLPPGVHKYIKDGKITYGAALQLLNAPSPEAAQQHADDLVAASEGKPVTRTAAERSVRKASESEGEPGEGDDEEKPASNPRRQRSTPAMKALLESADPEEDDYRAVAVCKFMLDTIAGKGAESSFMARLAKAIDALKPASKAKEKKKAA